MAWTAAGNIRGPQGPQGQQGVQGNPGQQGPAGPAGLNWRGAWSAANSYAVNDSVSWGGSTYFATQSKVAGSPPPTGTAADPGANDSAVNTGWAVLSLEGAQGPQGIQGNPGVQGNPGIQGNPGVKGDTGLTGARGSKWFVGTGAPTAGNTVGAVAGDQYLDGNTGDVYTLS